MNDESLNISITFPLITHVLITMKFMHPMNQHLINNGIFHYYQNGPVCFMTFRSEGFCVITEGKVKVALYCSRSLRQKPHLTLRR